MIEKLSTTTFQETSTTFVTYDLDEMEHRLSCWKDALAEDMAEEQRIVTLQSELSKTLLSDDDKNKIVNSQLRSPSGISVQMIADLEAEIAMLKTL